MLSKKFFSRDQVFALVVLVLVSGFLVLAVMDEAIRPAFVDLTKVAVGAYIGLLIPNAKVS